MDAGYRVKPQYAVGAYRIDIVVEGESSRVAVECDGAAFHSTAEQIRSDLDRQALLERMGWQFHRLRGSDFYRDPEAASRRLVARLDELGIKPLGQESHESTNGTRQPDELLERVKRRAGELLFEWFESSRSTVEAWEASPANVVDDAGSPISESRLPFVTGSEPMPFDGVSRAADEVQQQAALILEPSDRPDPAARLFEATQPLPRQQSQPGELARPDNNGGLAGVSSAAAAAEYFRAQGLRVEDKRPKGGALWVYGPRSELAPAMKTLGRTGIRFFFSEKRSGWYLSER